MNASIAMRELEGQVALVTGVTRRAGIGSAIAWELARAGARLAIADYRDYDQKQSWGLQPGETETLIADLGKVTEVYPIELDLSLASAPRELMEKAHSHFGQLDILVNNAAHWEPGGVDAIDSGQLDRAYAVNTRATVLLCAEFSHYPPHGHSRFIINITSGQGAAPMPGELAYVVTKASIDALTITLAHELAERNISVFAIDPGPTDTGWLTPDQKAEMKREGKLALPADIGHMVRALITGTLAATSGQIIRLQG